MKRNVIIKLSKRFLERVRPQTEVDSKIQPKLQRQARTCGNAKLYTVLFYKLGIKCQPEKGLTVAQFGPPSLPVPGTFVSRIKEESVNRSLIVSDEISLKGIFNLRLQTESI